MIPENIIEEIKAKNDIVDVISSYVTLKRAGSHMQGLCPFHNEKSPSFTVFSDTQSFYCFGCGAAGDVVTFIRKAENLDYVEALQRLAGRAGVDIPEENTERHGVRRSRVLEMNKEAARFFRSQLFLSSDAKAYFINRGLNRETIMHFGLGYSGRKGWEVVDHLKKLGYTEEEMLAGRLIGRNENGIFSYFRNRVMFPIIDTSGSVIGFGGRIIGAGEPKYLNTPDTIAFNKGKNLFALNYAKKHCEKEMILCEGYMDVIAMHAAGFENAVATLGTALTQEQARVMKRYTEKIIISYDNDNAGHTAADRASKILTEAGLDVRILRIKDAKDPDEYIKNFGRDKFKLMLDGSETKFDFILNNVLSKHDIKSDGEKIKAANELCNAIAGVSSAVERELYMGKSSKVLGISVESLKNEVDKAVRRRRITQNHNYEKQMENKAMGIGDRINPEYSANVKAAKSEEAILGILMLYSERRAEVAGENPPVTEDDFVTDFNKRVFIALKNIGKEQINDVGVMGAEFTSDEMSRIYEIMHKRDTLESASDEVFFDNIQALRDAKLQDISDIDELIASKLGENRTEN